MERQVDPKTKHSRSERMIRLSKEMESEFCGSLVGNDEEVLVEAYESGRRMATGTGSRYVRIEIQGEADLIGMLVPVRVVGAARDFVIAERVLPREEGFKS